MVNQQTNAAKLDWRLRCYGCYRPIDRCFCDQVPLIDNQTQVLILQHFRERFHPFNTARILQRSLRNSQLFADSVAGLAHSFLETPSLDNAALLYPGDGSQLLESLDVHDRPKQLVVLDGTWHHTKTLFRDIPQLQGLRRVCLAPAEPSRYGIRREPHVLFLSTLEATVAALRFLEPDTTGYEKLVAAFHSMVENQMAHPKSGESVRRKHRPRAPLNIPKVLRQQQQNIVVLYAETSPHPVASPLSNEMDRAPTNWVAERLGTGERFEVTLTPPNPLSNAFLTHIELSESDFANAVSMETFRREWELFLKPTDTVAYYYSNCTRLLKFVGTSHPLIYLKSIQLHSGRKNGGIEELLTALDVDIGEPCGKGRAGKRLANSIALSRYLSTCDLFRRQNASESGEAAV